jgi:hypothetical protein
MSYAQELRIKQHLIDKKKQVKAGDIGKWGVMAKKDWGIVSSDLKTMIYNYKELELNMCFIAHDRVSKEEEEDEDSDNYVLPTIGPRLMPSVASVLNAAVGVIGNTFIRERTKIVKNGKEKIEKQITEYCLRLGPHSVYVTKVRKPKGVKYDSVLVDPEYSDILDLIMSTADD